MFVLQTIIFSSIDVLLSTFVIFLSLFFCFIATIIWMIISIFEKRDQKLLKIGLIKFPSSKIRWHKLFYIKNEKWGRVCKFSDNFSYSVLIEKNKFSNWKITSKWTFTNKEILLEKSFFKFSSVVSYLEKEQFNTIVNCFQIWGSK